MATLQHNWIEHEGNHITKLQKEHGVILWICANCENYRLQTMPQGKVDVCYFDKNDTSNEPLNKIACSPVTGIQNQLAISY